MAIFIIVIVGAVLLALTDLNLSGTQGFAQDYQSQRAFYAAESGAQIGLNRIFMGGAACASFTLSLNGTGLVACSVEVGCTQVNVAGIDYYTLNSDATCGSGAEAGRRQIEVRARSE
jgi:MSHA biogenesis protein MshP